MQWNVGVVTKALRTILVHHALHRTDKLVIHAEFSVIILKLMKQLSCFLLFRRRRLIDYPGLEIMSRCLLASLRESRNGKLSAATAHDSIIALDRSLADTVRMIRSADIHTAETIWKFLLCISTVVFDTFPITSVVFSSNIVQSQYFVLVVGALVFFNHHPCIHIFLVTLVVAVFLGLQGQGDSISGDWSHKGIGEWIRNDQ
mmetsp:Transcript_535/g.930  ORF Transcript_535/g.930 Transcript_535/m.930 type:complete len:202 (+) Transcript_535:115-720(+)